MCGSVFFPSVSTVAMVIKTQTPSVKARLRSQEKLHCQFAIDHRGSNITLEWHWQHRGERSKLFSYNSHSGQTHGSGVELKALVGGEASYTLPFTKWNSEGTYICSVSVIPLFVSLDISLHIEGEEKVIGHRPWQKKKNSATDILIYDV